MNLSKLKKPSLNSVLILVLLVSIGILRLHNLGYSDYISDEPGTFFYRGGKKDPHMDMLEFIISQRKGPIQLLIGYIPYTIVGDYSNELAQRLPFAFFSILSVLALYEFLKKTTGNYMVSFFAAFLLGVNGLISGYGRIAQYQNVLLYFDFISLYYFASFLKNYSDKVMYRHAFLASLFFGLGFLTHWYAVFILIPAALFYIYYLLRSEHPAFTKIKVTLLAVAVALALTLPFVIPYQRYHSTNEATQDYSERILGGGGPFSERSDLIQFKLYNPFYVYEFYIVGVSLAAVLLILRIVRKQRDQGTYLISVFLTWFVSLMLIFRYLISYSGLHFYNIFLPVVILCGYVVSEIHTYLPTRFKKTTLLLVTPLIFFYYQTYLIFVDHSVEYPWRQETILWLKTPSYSHEDAIRHKTGFPHSRYWSQINDYINDTNTQRAIESGYISNEDKAISKFYMDAPQERSDTYYAIGVKRPYNFANDYKFPQIKDKRTIHKIEDDEGTTVVQIYLVEPKDN